MKTKQRELQLQLRGVKEVLRLGGRQLERNFDVTWSLFLKVLLEMEQEKFEKS